MCIRDRLSFVRLRSGHPGRMPSPDEAMAHVYTPEEQVLVASYRKLQIVGTPEQVRGRIEDIVARTQADEVMIATHARVQVPRVRCNHYFVGLGSRDDVL